MEVLISDQLVFLGLRSKAYKFQKTYSMLILEGGCRDFTELVVGKESQGEAMLTKVRADK